MRVSVRRSRPAHRPAARYRVLALLLRPALWLWVAKVAIDIARNRAGDGVAGGLRPARAFAAQRLGYRIGPRSAAPAGGPPVRWLHAASVGEVMTALPLLRALVDQGQTLLVTTATPSGAAVLAERAPAGVRHRYLPIDTRGAVARFLDDESPATGWIVETELWPALFAGAATRSIPLTILSARLSPRTADGPARWLQPAYRQALEGVRILARSEADAGRFQALGAAAMSIHVLGDLKRAWQDVPSGPQPAESQPPGPPAATGARRYALAASTHEGEESGLSAAWLALPGDELLVIVPRHPQRADVIERQILERRPGMTRVPRSSRGDKAQPTDRLLLGDTFGELEHWYRFASAAFIGGSLVERGGHNLLEAARHALPIATGTHTCNFQEIVGDLLAADALRVVADADQAARWLYETVRECPASANDGAGQRALTVAYADADILTRYMEELLRAPPTEPDEEMAEAIFERGR